MYTYLPVVNQDYYLIFKDNNPIPQAKAYSESEAQTIINALNNQWILREIQNHINDYLELDKQGSRTILEMIMNLMNQVQPADSSQTEEIEEAGPPQYTCNLCGHPSNENNPLVLTSDNSQYVHKYIC